MPACLPKKTKVDLFKTMVRIRVFEEKALELFTLGLTPGRMHSYIGQEGIAAGACAAIEEKDVIVSTHRGGGHLVARGADPRRLFAEYMGKATGYGRGKGGPMHVSIPELGVLCTTGIVGNGIPVAVGAALACQSRKSSQVVLCFFGDGAANTGAFHEALNIASIWKLPILFICENNQYGETMPVSKAIAIEDLADRALAYGMAGQVVDGNDVEAVYTQAKDAAEKAREGEGPTLIEGKTYRIGQHFSGESNHYRTSDEVEQWKARDPIIHYRALLENEKTCGRKKLSNIETAARQEVHQAAEQAKDDPLSPPDSLLRDVWVPPAGKARS